MKSASKIGRSSAELRAQSSTVRRICAYLGRTVRFSHLAVSNCNRRFQPRAVRARRPVRRRVQAGVGISRQVVPHGPCFGRGRPSPICNAFSTISDDCRLTWSQNNNYCCPPTPFVRTEATESNIRGTKLLSPAHDRPSWTWPKNLLN